MRRRNDLGLERTLRRSRPEPRPDFLRRLADEIRADLHEDRHPHARWLSLGLAVTLTSVVVGALGAVGAGGSARSATEAVVHVVRLAFASPQNEVQLATNTPAQDQYAKCNSGRGNLSETETGTRQTNSSTLVNPHEGGRGPGPYPTDDCDPGKSGPQNRGGD